MVISSEISSLVGANAQVVTDVATQARLLGASHAVSRSVGIGALAGQLGLAGSVQAFDDAFLFGALICALGLFPAFLLPNKPVAGNKEPAVME